MERYIGLDAHASSCTLGIVGPSGKRLGSQVVETNARALIEVLRGIPRNRHLCLEEGTLSGWLYEVLEPHVEELTVAGVGKSRGPKTDKLDAFALAEKLRIGSLETRVYKNRGQFRRAGGTGEELRLPGRRHGAGEEPAQERAALERSGLRRGALGLLEARPGGVVGQAAGSEQDDGRVAVRGARRTRGIEGEGREGVAGGSTQASRVACAEDVPGSGSDPDGGAPAGGGDAVPVPEPEQILGVLRTGRGDAELVGLGAGSGVGGG